jgi:hypothetical protein
MEKYVYAEQSQEVSAQAAGSVLVQIYDLKSGDKDMVSLVKEPLTIAAHRFARHVQEGCYKSSADQHEQTMAARSTAGVNYLTDALDGLLKSEQIEPARAYSKTMMMVKAMEVTMEVRSTWQCC